MAVPVAHVEAGLRSFNRAMPEEINRIVTDHVSALFFCPTSTAKRNLASEGIQDGVFEVGDVMYDATLAAVMNCGLAPTTVRIVFIRRIYNPPRRRETDFNSWQTQQAVEQRIPLARRRHGLGISVACPLPFADAVQIGAAGENLDIQGIRRGWFRHVLDPF